MSYDVKNVLAAQALTTAYHEIQITTIANHPWSVDDLFKMIKNASGSNNQQEAEIASLSLLYDVLATDVYCQEHAHAAIKQAATLTAAEYSEYHIWCMDMGVRTGVRIAAAFKTSLDNIKPTTANLAQLLAGATE